MRGIQYRALPHLGLAIATLLLAGCAELKQWARNDFKVGPEYFKPAVPVADEWIDHNNSRVISRECAVDEDAWWRSLNDPNIDQLVFVAYQQNLSLRAAGMRVLEARAQRDIAAGLLLPQSQQAFANYSRIQLSNAGNSLGLPILPTRAFDFWSTGFNVGWELDFWGKFRRNLESADANLNASIEDHDDVLVCLIAETASAYLEMREFEQRLKYARTNVQIQKDSLGIAESRFKNGAVSELDVTISKSNLAETQALIPVLEKGLRLANNRLCVLLGIPPRDLRSEFGPGAIPVAPAEVVVGVPAELLRRRPDVRRSERQVAAQSARIGIAAADLFPAFTINGTINWQASRFADVFTSAANAGNIGPAFNWNILNYGRIRNNVRAQDAKFQELAIQYQETVLKANAEVEDAIVCFLQAHERVRVLRIGVKASERSQALVMKRYREGDVDISPVFIAQSILARQQDELAAAEAEVTRSMIRIYKTLGGGWRIRLGEAGPPQVPPMRETLPSPDPETLPSPDPAAKSDPAVKPDPAEPSAPANPNPAARRDAAALRVLPANWRDHQRKN